VYIYLHACCLSLAYEGISRCYSNYRPALFQSPVLDVVIAITIIHHHSSQSLLLPVFTTPHSDALFLAGDTAQAVEEGVDFRFEEVRAVVHDISGGKQKVRVLLLRQRRPLFVLNSNGYNLPNSCYVVLFEDYSFSHVVRCICTAHLPSER
jgi:hypothetical protein